MLVPRWQWAFHCRWGGLVNGVFYDFWRGGRGLLGRALFVPKNDTARIAARAARNQWIPGLVLCLVVMLSSYTFAALPSRVLKLRDTNGQVAIGLGDTSGLVRIASPSGVRIIASGEGSLGEFPKAIRVTGSIGERPPGQQVVWRVQIKAVRDEGAALDLRRQVEAASGLAAYVIHVEPWHKVQVGDAFSPTEAEELKEKLVSLGYQDAWVTTAEVPAPAVATDNMPLEKASFLRVEDDAGSLLTILNQFEVTIESINDEPLMLEMRGSPPRSYRGSLRLSFLGEERIKIVNIIDLEAYLYGVVGAELYSKSREDMAALAAQAVAARTYTIENLGKHELEGFDLCSTVHCQVYQGIERESPLIQEAVDMTKGEILVYGGQTISAVYHSSSGGATAGAEQVWSTRYSGYLRPRPDEVIDPETDSLVKLGEDRPGYHWEVEWQADELSSTLHRYLGSEISIKVPSTAVLREIKIGKKDALGRAKQLLVTYDEVDESGGSRRAEYEVRKDKIRWVLRRPDGRILPSTRFDLEVKQADGKIQKVVAVGKGNGHGLGLSQAGALHMSRLGYGYRDILLHYYTDVTFTPLSDYYKAMESRLAWEKKGLLQSWVAILGSEQGIDGLTDAIKWSPGGDRIAYGIEGDAGGLWVFDTITGEQIRVLVEPVLEIAWKSDGSALAVVSQIDGQGLRRLSRIEIAVDSGGQNRVLPCIIAEARDLHSPTWLPDSDLVFFEQNGMIYGAQGEVSVPLLTEAKAPAVTPDGRQVALIRQGDIWIYQLTTGIAARLCQIGNARSLLWSPDGEHLAATTDQDVAVINVQTQDIVARLPGGSPTWSSDGSFLAYVAKTEDGTASIQVWELVSMETEALTTFQSSGKVTVHWSASGNALAYTTDRELHLLTLR